MKRRRLVSLLLTAFFLTSCSFNLFPSSESVVDTDSTLFEDTETILSTDEESPSEVESESILTEDPYVGMSEAEFYLNYTPSTSYWDSYYRTKHYFMSGSIEPQLQRPTLEQDPPMDGTKYVANSHNSLSSNGLSYTIVDKDGNPVNTIFKGGAYVTLEEVSAYLYAFGDIPPNYVSNRNTKPTQSPWGKYLRVNHSYFSCDTDRYKYEPDLPDTESKLYFEIDIGTTGSYEYSTVSNKGEYNNGTKIIRGASRIVYTRQYKNGGLITKPSDRYVFYTFNHYNDFQQYLNYQYGWGEWFGNCAGGGSMDNQTGIYKTSYPSVTYRDFVEP